MSEIWLCILVMGLVTATWGVLILTLNREVERLKNERDALGKMIHELQQEADRTGARLYRLETAGFLRLRDLDSLHVYLDAKTENHND